MQFRFIVFMILAALVLSLASHQQAAAVTYEINQAPPPPIYEVDPGARPGYILAPGYWRWNGKRHIWTASHWIKERPGYRWMPDRWEQRGNQWAFAAGYWESDPNKSDEMDAESMAETEAEHDIPVNAKSAKASHAKAKKSPPKINYNDRAQWPRVIHH